MGRAHKTGITNHSSGSLLVRRPLNSVVRREQKKKLFPPITVGNSANIIFPFTGIDAIRVYSTRKLLEDTFSKNIKTIALTLSASPPRKIP
jgi:hypothetical protein